MSEFASTTRPFNPSRLTLARRRRGYTITKFAEKVGVEARTASAWEKPDEFDPSADRIKQIADLLKFPESFFFGEDVEEPSPAAVSFRAMSKMTARQRASALSAATVAFLLDDWIRARFDLPSSRVPDLGQFQDKPEAAADSLRQQWGIGVFAIKNMVHLLEANGVRVFSLAISAREVDAFSTWRQGIPYVFLNTQKTAEHSRFDAAHELGHLVLHQHGSPAGQEAERQANRFASAFLMPEADVLARAPRLATVDQLAKLKRCWFVSVAALAYRLHDLNVITDWHYRSLCIELAKRGKANEPNPIPREASQVFQQVLHTLRGENVSRRDIAEQLSISTADLDELIFGLALTGLNGGGGASQGKRPNLRVVASN